MTTPTENPTYLYKILPSTSILCDPFPEASILPKTPLDLTSRFIHLSTSAQVPYVLDRFFNSAETESIWLVKMDHQKLASSGDVRWEAAGKDGSLFAHLYGGEVTGLVIDDVQKLNKDDGWDRSLQEVTGNGWLA